MHERIDQNDPNIHTIADLQRSITLTLTYLLGRASVAELFGLQSYLSTLASQMAPPSAIRHGPQAPLDEALWEKAGKQEMTAVMRQQLAELERQSKLMRAQQGQAQQALAHCTPAQFRQES